MIKLWAFSTEVFGVKTTVRVSEKIETDLKRFFLLCGQSGLLALICAGCASVKSSVVNVELDQDSGIRFGDSNPVQRKKGESFEVSQAPVFVEAPGKVGVLVIPMRGQPQNVKLSLKSLEVVPGAVSESEIASSMNLLLMRANEFQSWLAEKKTKEALTLVDELIQKYPRIVQLKFMKASCLVLMDEREKARVLLDLALKEEPGNQAGKELLRFLTPGSSEKKGSD